MKKESKKFNQGLELLKNKSYNEAIDLFKQDLENNPNNPIAYHNIGLAQIYLGINQKGKSLLESAIQHIRKAIMIVESTPGETFPTANDNLKWATEELNKLDRSLSKIKFTQLDSKKAEWLKTTLGRVIDRIGTTGTIQIENKRDNKVLLKLSKKDSTFEILPASVALSELILENKIELKEVMYCEILELSDGYICVSQKLNYTVDELEQLK